MWKLITFNKTLGMWMVCEGTTDGYKYTKVFSNRLTAMVYGKIHGVNFSR